MGWWIYIGAVGLHRGGGAVWRWIYIGAVRRWGGGAVGGGAVGGGAVGGGFTKCQLIHTFSNKVKLQFTVGISSYEIMKFNSDST